jgi:hypothetical protein
MVWLTDSELDRVMAVAARSMSRARPPAAPAPKPFRSRGGKVSDALTRRKGA